MAAKRFALLDKCVCKGRDCFIVAIDFDGVNLPEYEIEYEDTGERFWVYEHMLKPRKGKNKYNAVKVFDADHGTFDSQAEYAHFHELLLLQKAGAISDLRRQVSFVVIDAGEAADKRVKTVRYKVDFTYCERNENGKAREVACEVKGMITSEARLKIYLFLMRYPHIRFELVGTQL